MQLARLSILTLLVFAGCASPVTQEVGRAVKEAGMVGQVNATTADEIEEITCSVVKRRSLWILFKYVFWGQGGREEVWNPRKERIC